MIIRNLYLDQCKKLIGNPIIKVLVGQRRSGKSVLLRQISDFIGANNTIFIDLEQYDMIEQFKTHDKLHEYLKKSIKKNIQAICIDEIQNIPNREKTIVSIRNQYKNIDIFITGSNSTMLSGQLTTLLRGRYYEISIFPFSYEEFCIYYKYKKGKESFSKFIEIGGYSSCYPFQDQTQKKQWIRQMMDSIILRDIIERYGIKEVSLFHEVYLYLISTNTQLTNASSIQKELIKKGHNISLITIQNYIKFLEENFLIYTCELYDIHGKKLFERLKKYYSSDHSLRSYFFSNFDIGYGKILENLVYMEAKKKGYQIYTGRKGDFEVDFILEKNHQKIYIQVCYLLSSEDVILREIRSLDGIKDNWPKYLLSMDDQLLGNSKTGIKHYHIWDLYEIL